LGGYIRGLAIGPDGSIYASEWDQRAIFKYSPDGTQLAVVQTPARSYGMVTNGTDLWFVQRGNGGNGTLYRIDTTQIVDDSIGENNVNTAALHGPFIQSWSGSRNAGYGIAIDGKGRVWVGTHPLRDLYAIRFDPSDNTWAAIPNTDCLAFSGVGRGVTVSTTGGSNDVVWVAQHGGSLEGDCSDSNSGSPRARLTGFNTDTLAIVNDRDLSSLCHIPIGVGIGESGNVWSVCRDTPENGSLARAGSIVGINPAPGNLATNTNQA
ncbi:MAG: hypothetical protein AAFX99_27930, partial [Myxococcota bacterium]